jgi:hypothetical protein
MFKAEHQTPDIRTDGVMFTLRVKGYEMAHEDLRRPQHGRGCVEVHLARRRELDDSVYDGAG